MGQFIVRWLVHVIDIKWVPKFRNWSRDLSHAPLRSNFHNLTEVFMECISAQNLECIAYPFESYGGSQILNLGHVTLTTPTLGVSLLCID